MRENRAKARTFEGGIHIPEMKDFTAGKPTADLPPPKELVIPLHQHTGAPCEPLVNVGDLVEPGQKIGDSQAFISAPVHASLAGKVVAIGPRPYFTGTMVNSIVIEVSDPQPAPARRAQRMTLADATPDEIRRAVREAGIVGLGGAAFPAHVKLTPPPDKPIDSVIINGCECEPFLTCDHRAMLEHPDELVEGLLIIMKAVGASHGYIGIENNKPDAIELLAGKVSGNISVVPLEIRYPQGAEKQLIKAVLNRAVPPGKLPMEVGTVVHNVGTALAIRDAVFFGLSLTERVLTVTGPIVKDPMNFRVKIGTPVQHILDHCGGFSEPPAKVVLGGPMTGWAQSSLTVPVVKGTSGIVVLPKEMVRSEVVLDCVRCGKCVETCPMRLMPNNIGVYAQAGMLDEAEKWGVMDCFECGTCSYVCPSKRPLVLFVRQAKGEIQARRRRAQ